MNLETTTGATIELETPVTEWVQLSDDPFNSDGLVLCDAGDWFLLVRMHPVLGPVEVVEAGRELRAFTEYDREALAAKLDAEYGDELDDEHRTTILDWYDNLVSELVELDLYDPDFQTTFIEGTAYLSGMPPQDLTEELVSKIEDWDKTVAPDIAAQVNDWWTPNLEEADDLAGANSYAARVELVS